MEEYLMDSNIVIDFFGNNLLQKPSFVSNLPAIISVVARIEIMGWYNATPAQLNKLQLFTENAFIYQLTETIIQKTISVRQKHKIKLPDAIVAATALIENKTLVTRNVNDFKNIPGLNLFNPWDM